MSSPAETDSIVIQNNEQGHRNQVEPEFPPRTKKFRTFGTKFFLTFPKCEVSPNLALTRVIFKHTDLKWIVCSQEKHLDGSNHLHLCIWLKKKISYRDPNYWDFIAKKHGNYQVARDIVHVLKYVTKHNNYVSHGIDVQSYLKSKKSKKGLSFEWAAAQMKAGASIEDLDEENPAIVLQNLRKLQDYQRFLNRKKRKLAGSNLTAWTPIDLLSLPQDFRSLGAWLNSNLGSPRIFKQKQLWIYGGTNLGKTSLMMSLMKYFRIYLVPLDCRYLDDYDDAEYDLIMFDEFKGQKTIRWLNGFVEGSPFPVLRRYNSTIKNKNLPVIVLSNYSIEESYSKVNMFHPMRLDTVRTRFQVEEVRKFINVNI